MRRRVFQVVLVLVAIALVTGLFLQRLRRAPPRPRPIAVAPRVEPVTPATLHPDEQALPGAWVDVPAARPDAPLVLALHGRGDTAGHFAALAGRFGSGFAFRALEAPWPFRDGKAWFRSDSPAQLRADLEADYPLLAAHARQAHGDQHRPVALLGFSQGCMLAAHFAITHPDLVQAVLCIGGQFKFEPPAPPPGTPRPAFLFVHAVDDPMVPIGSAKAAAQTLENRGFAVEFLEHQDGHSIPEHATARMRGWLQQHLARP